ncbi:MAG TPA: choice-of-anchor D domain-containing protein, partial [Myxococcales bacterium]|nr:choice-of-anchor D domain-containing protein [Myxococcales bacterium]
MQPNKNVFIYLLILLVACACGDDGGGDYSVSNQGKIEISPAERNVEISIGQTQIGDIINSEIRVRNVADGLLTVSKLQLDYQAPAEGDSHGTAFQLVTETELPVELNVVNSTEGISEFILNVQYTRQDNFTGRTATLTIVSDSRDDRVLTVNFKEKQASAVMLMSPSVLDFETVPLGSVGERLVTIKNTGTDDLIVDAFTLRNHPDFSLVIDDQTYEVNEETSTKAQLVEPVVVPSGGAEQIKVTFSPQTPTAATGELILFSNDPGAPSGKAVILLGNHSVPCIQVKPGSLEFGGKIVGTKSQLPVEICNCSEAPLKLKGIALVAEETASDFSLILDVPGIDPITGINPSVPYVVDVNQCIQVSVQCVPDTISPIDGDNKSIADTGLLRILSNSFEQQVDVPMSCIGVNVTCPVAVAGVDEGEQVIPQTTLHLSGDQS